MNPSFFPVRVTGAFLKRRAGFTLGQLLVCVFIVGVLSALAWPYYKRAADQSRYRQLQAQARTLVKAQQAYYLQNGSFTIDMDSLPAKLPYKHFEEISPTHYSVGGAERSYTLENGDNLILWTFQDGPVSVVTVDIGRVGLPASFSVELHMPYSRSDTCQPSLDVPAGEKFCLSVGATAPPDTRELIEQGYVPLYYFR